MSFCHHYSVLGVHQVSLVVAVAEEGGVKIFKLRHFAHASWQVVQAWLEVVK